MTDKDDYHANKEKNSLEESLNSSEDFLQQLERIALSLGANKHDLQTYMHKAQKASDHIEEASTKMMFQFEKFSEIEYRLQESLAETIELAAQTLLENSRKEVEALLTPLRGELQKTTQALHAHVSYSKPLKKGSWIYGYGVLGLMVGIIATFLFLTFMRTPSLEIDHTLIKYGQAFLQYYETLSPKDQDALLEKMKPFVR